MRKLIVSNLVSLDGYYEGKDRDLNALFEYFHPDYASDEQFDHYNTERLRAADTVVLSGRTSYLGFKDYWSGVPGDPKATAIRQEFARFMAAVDKVAVSDHLTVHEVAPWEIRASFRAPKVTRRLPRSKSNPQGYSEILQIASCGTTCWRMISLTNCTSRSSR